MSLRVLDGEVLLCLTETFVMAADNIVQRFKLLLMMHVLHCILAFL